MGTAWNKHIQPFLDSWQWEHFGLIWEPFLKIYPKLDDIQRKNVEDALIESIFDSDVDIAIKALFIVEALYDSNLASRRLFDLVANRLRVYAHAVKVDDPGSY